MNNIRFAIRTLSRNLAFSVPAVLTLALGIGATTAIFTVVKSVLLTPPPYPAPQRLYVLGNPPDMSSQTGEMFHYIRARARTFENIALQGGTVGWNLVKGNHAEYVTGIPVSRGFFDVLGVHPQVGRGFTVAEDQPGGPRAVVLSALLSRRLFGDTNPNGELIQLGGVPHRVVGVMPASFRSLPAADLWTAARVSPQNNGQNYAVIGRLRVDESRLHAANQLDALRPMIPREVRSVSETRARSFRWVEYQEWLGAAQWDAMMLLAGAVSFLLLIACVNVAGLQLARAVASRREMATRTALGATASQVARQVLTESVLLALIGGILGLFLADVGVRILLDHVPQGLLGDRSVSIDRQVLTFALMLSVGVGLLFGLAPALGSARFDLKSALAQAGRQTAGRSTLRLRSALAILQVALSVVLLIGAGLFIRTLVNMRSVDLGFDPSNIVVGKMSLQGASTQTSDDVANFFEQTLSRLRSIPGVTAVAVTNNIPVERGLNLPIEPPANGIVNQRRSVDWRYVTEGHFQVFRLPLRDGRLFDVRDNSGGAPVVIVNEAFARVFFGRPRVIGEFIQLVGGEAPRQIVGIVADVKGRSGAGWTRGLNALAAPAPPAIYVPVSQVSAAMLQTVHSFFPMSWVVRTNGSRNDVGADVQRVVQSTAPQLVFRRFETMEEVIAEDLAYQRFLTTLVTVFAGVAMLLAAVGLYGLSAYSATQRTQEVGIRMALGATAEKIFRAFMTEGVIVALIGIVAGLGSAFVVSRMLPPFIFNVAPHDPLTFAIVSFVLLAVTLVATLLPSMQAARTNPVRAMRAE